MSDSQEVAVELDLTGDDLTLNEKIEVEAVCGGRPFNTLRDEGTSSFHRALVWVVARRENPAIQLHEAGEVRARFDG